MKTVGIQQRIGVSAERAWTILRAGDRVDRWFPAVTACRLEGAGVGARRVCTIQDHDLVESIETIEDSIRLLQYRVLEQELMPIREVLGTVQVSAISPSEASVLWFVNFELDDDAALPAIKAAIEQMYIAGLAGLEALARPS